MELRRILIPLLGGDNDKLCLNQSLKLARNLCAHADALFVRPNPEDAIPYLGLGDGELNDIRDDYRRRAAETGEKASAESHKQFVISCRKHGIAKVKHSTTQGSATATWNEVVGRVTHEIPYAAKFCDLTVFAGPLEDYRRLLPNVLECTLLESGRPLLFVPRGSMESLPKHVAIAWDESVPAVRAIFGAETFLHKAKTIRVLSILERRKDPADPQKLIEYLAWHGLNAKSKFIEKRDKEVGQALLDEAQVTGADFLIMGGYAHTRFEEVVFRGTTLYAIQNTSIPLLMVH